ncbi:recombination protein RecT [Mycobacteroides chelonae]|uniref:recombination protein RecT n=1 Tax=Mycobacteroides chelonae TaxID=1774 RepID=UPI0008A9BD3C|nr:recombination protein RecT [Mycobacteroides chelonae]OHU29063.1 recombinase RecT [Mycobacteroides chelonae]
MARDLARRAQQSVAQQGGGESLQSQLAKMETQFQRAMPRGVEAVQLIRDVMTCVKQTPKLAQCDPVSVLGSAMTCAQLGLRPGVGALGHAWILPFWDKKSNGNKAQLIIGYKGYVELGHRSEQIASLHSRIVYSNDQFEVEYGAAEDKWVHRPNLDGPRGDARLFYAVGRLANGGYSLTDPMTVADMEEHRDKFAMAKYQGKVIGPWVDHFDAMGKKTMLLRLMALMPKSTEIQRAIDNDGSVRLDLSEGAIDSPTHIDGEVVGEPIDEPTGERESIDVRGSQADPSGAVQMATGDQLARLKKIRAEQGFGGDDSGWFDYVLSATQAEVRRDQDLTQAQAQSLIDLFDEDAQK